MGYQRAPHHPRRPAHEELRDGFQKSPLDFSSVDERPFRPAFLSGGSGPGLFTGRFFFPFFRASGASADNFSRPGQIGVRVKGGTATPAFQHDACIRPSLFFRSLRSRIKPGVSAVRAADGKGNGVLNNQRCRVSECPGNVARPERLFRMKQPDCCNKESGAQGIQKAPLLPSGKEMEAINRILHKKEGDEFTGHPASIHPSIPG